MGTQSFATDRSVPLKDLTSENITENVHAINSNCEDPRLKFLMQRAVTYLHDFARETQLTADEWMTTLQFLTAVGQTCTDVRQEFILLSDVLGLSLLVDSIEHPKPPHGTESTVLGPFHTHEAKHSSNGSTISGDPDGAPCLVVCTVHDTSGQPLAGVEIDVWETDSKGFYDVQYAERNGPDGRAILTSDPEGKFWFKATLPVPYPIPHDGPVGKLLQSLHRHPYRPSHMHFMLSKPGYDRLVTALYLKGDPYEASDAVFGVKDSLIVEVGKVVDEAKLSAYNVKPGCALISYDFVLTTESEAKSLRQEVSKEMLKR